MTVADKWTNETASYPGGHAVSAGRPVVEVENQHGEDDRQRAHHHYAREVHTCTGNNIINLITAVTLDEAECSFRQLVSQSHILHCLLREQRDDGLTGRLRSRNKYPTVRSARTNRFKNSFIRYAIANY